MGILTLFTSASHPRNLQTQDLNAEKPIDFKQKQILWADSVLATMSLEQKIGQLFMISAFSNRNENDYRRVEEQIKKYHLIILLRMMSCKNPIN